MTDVVESVGPLDFVVVLLREFLHRSGALRAVAIIDGAPGEEPALVDCPRLAPVEVTVGERTVALAHSAELDAEPEKVPEVTQLPPFAVDRETGEITAPLGGIEHLGGAVRALADVLGPRDVAMVVFETTTPELPLSITARRGDPLVLSIGEDEYEMDPGWP